MPRNIDRRVEVLFPVRDPQLVKQLQDEVLAIYLTDNVKARLMLPDGGYQRVLPASDDRVIGCQEWLIKSRDHA